MQFSSLRFAVALSLGSTRGWGTSGWLLRGREAESDVATISPWWRVSGASTLPQGSVRFSSDRCGCRCRCWRWRCNFIAEKKRRQNNNKNEAQKVNAVGPELSTLYVVYVCICARVWISCESQVSWVESAESCQQDLLAAIAASPQLAQLAWLLIPANVCDSLKWMPFWPRWQIAVYHRGVYLKIFTYLHRIIVCTQVQQRHRGMGIGLVASHSPKTPRYVDRASKG